jgi:aromatic-L-amino-acid decarboxylase
VNSTGEIFISGTVLNGRFTLRLAIGNRATKREHVARAWALIREGAERLSEGIPWQSGGLLRL